MLTPADGTSGTDPCLHTERCFLISVAPWCPVCRAVRPLIQLIRDRAKGGGCFGVKIIISSDKLPALQNEARQLGDNTYLDPRNRFIKESGFNAFPTWVVIDGQGKVLNHFSAGITQTDDTGYYYVLHRLGLDQRP